MALQLYKIATVEVGSAGASSISFTSIPSGYTDLKLVVSGRADGAIDWHQLYLELNGSTSISVRTIQGPGSGAVASYNNSIGECGPIIGGSTATANTFGSAELYFPNYSSANNKSISVDGVSETNAAGIYAILAAGLYSSSSAISQITVKPKDASAIYRNFVQYSTATLYGIL
jgi:hypothetical protein